MNKKILIFLLLTINTLVKPGTNVFVQNNTPYKFSVEIKQKKTHLNEKHWKKHATTIIPWGKKTKILYTGRDTGVKNNKEYAFYMTLKPNNGKSTILKIKLEGKFFIGSKIWKAVDSEEWREGNSAYSREYSINNKIKLDILHKFYEAGTFNDILFVINKHQDISQIISKSASVFSKFIGNSSKENTKENITPINNKKITILAYNLFNLNPFFKDSPGIQKRSKIFPKAIDRLAKDNKTDFDVLIFSECFDDNGRREILKRLKTFGYKFSTCILGSGFHEIEAVFDEPIKQPYIVDFNSEDFKTDKIYQQAGEGDPPSGFSGGVLDGGIIIVSKYPIKKAREIIYKDSKASDKHAKKGAVYAKINKNGKNYHIFGTHTQASYDNVTQYSETRKKQFASLKKFVDKMNIPKNEPVFVCGDLNIDLISEDGKKEVNNVLEQINFSLPTKIGHSCSHDNLTNDFLQTEAEKPQLLDYILYSKNHLQPKKAKTEILIPRTNTPWNNKWNKKGRFDLSDHYPVFGYFEF